MDLGRVRFILVALIALRTALMIALSLQTSMTIDEPSNYVSAERAFQELKMDRIKDSEMPVTIFNAAVASLIDQVNPDAEPNLRRRLGSILINQLAIPFAFLLAIELGATAGVALLFSALIAFEPSILHHSLLVNPDGTMATFFLLLAWIGARWTKTRSRRELVYFGLILGLLQGVKLSAAYAVPLCIAWVSALEFKRRGMRGAMEVGAFIACSWMGLAAIYGFNRLGTPLGEVSWKSALFVGLAKSYPGFPLIFPVDYLRGLDWVYMIERGTRTIWFRGELYTKGFASYYPYVLLLKTPIPVLIACLWGWTLFLKRSVSARSLPLPTGFVLFLLSVIGFYFCFIFNNQIGIRYLLPIYPFLLLGMIWIRLPRLWVAAAATWVALSLAWQWPNYIGYFNEFLLDERKRWWHLGDSNLSWQQERAAWLNFTEQNKISKSRIGPPILPLETSFYVDVLKLSSIYGLPYQNELFIRKLGATPLSSFRGAWLEYRLTPAEVLAQIPLTRLAWNPPPVAPVRCTPSSNQGHVSLVRPPMKLRTWITVPFDGEVLIQVHASIWNSVSIGEVPLLAERNPRIALRATYSWQVARIRLEAGTYPIDAAIIPTPKPHWLQYIEPSFAIGAHLLTRGATPLDTAVKLEPCVWENRTR